MQSQRESQFEHNSNFSRLCRHNARRICWVNVAIQFELRFMAPVSLGFLENYPVKGLVVVCAIVKFDTIYYNYSTEISKPIQDI